MRDGRRYIPPTPASRLPVSPVTAESAGAASPEVASGEAARPSAPSAGTQSVQTAGTTSSGPTIAPAPVSSAAPAQRPTQRERFDDQNSLVGDGRKLAVPLPGAEKTQKKMGTMAQCQGPQAQQRYASLTGKERTEFARLCARYGITLSP